MKAIINEKLYDTTTSEVVYIGNMEALYKPRIRRISELRVREYNLWELKKSRNISELKT
jgi:hypothetical protein